MELGTKVKTPAKYLIDTEITEINASSRNISLK